jgi:hypothetical protein
MMLDVVFRRRRHRSCSKNCWELGGEKFPQLCIASGGSTDVGSAAGGQEGGDVIDVRGCRSRGQVN